MVLYNAKKDAWNIDWNEDRGIKYVGSRVGSCEQKRVSIQIPSTEPTLASMHGNELEIERIIWSSFVFAFVALFLHIDGRNSMME